MSPAPLPDHAAENARYWDGMADQWVAAGERAWAGEPTWGNWQAPDDAVRLLPEDMRGMRAIELGCGTAYVSAWMVRRGATVVGVDVSAEQLATAERLRAEHGLDLELRLESAEATSEADATFDFAVSEYGAAIWCDPYVWIPEAARLLKPGGRLHFLGNHPLALVCTPPDGAPTDATLHRDWRGMHRFDWREVEIDPGGIEFNLGIAEWMRLFRDAGFVVEDHLELHAPEPTQDRYAIPGWWAHRFPAEQVWKLRRT